ncbi:AraC family transcriptional regulator [Paenibacillus sp. N4]|uniref:helix-turn-helix transcriptional regulator n=1 Tax=Paenibacillus vietnamensis TaxID=2590547 RepID=UPI001CD05F80|nr:helix-turn-helix domain-containing protein [Paenibacillus vietnamensis]MCA0757489.1 AraC family transcriptional regulator [Paenibacillus vietnamensis]
MPTRHVIDSPFTIGTSSSYLSQIPYHSHSHYEIYYFRSGKANYIINDRIHVLEPGDLIVMHGMTLHRAYVDPSVPYHRTTIHFDPVYFKQLIQPAYADDLLLPFEKLQNVRLQLRGDRKLEAEASLEKLEKLYMENDPFSKQRAHALLLDFMILLNQLCEQPLKEKISFPSSKEHHVQTVISYIDMHFNEEITLEGIQDELHLSKYYLAKTFKEVTGTTIFQFLMQRRVYQAKIELLDSSRPITEIGYDVGFKHPSHFSRTFKLQTGYTPEQYRKRQRLDT